MLKWAMNVYLGIKIWMKIFQMLTIFRVNHEGSLETLEEKKLTDLYD